VIELLGVTKSFHQGKSSEFTALVDVSLRVAPAGVTVLKGPSGSGKTTLLTVIGCMARPTSGRIFLRGSGIRGFPAGVANTEVEITSLPERFLAGIRRATFGFIFQHFHLVKGITVLENVMLPAYPTGERRGATLHRAMELLEIFNVSRHAASRVEWLSGGEAQRVAIARSLINRPSVIVADEPTAHLDTRLSREFMQIVASLKDEGKTILVASHDPIVYDSPFVDSVVEMRDGRVLAGSAAR
jgi:putative ABC transport system ATP-binding protein